MRVNFTMETYAASVVLRDIDIGDGDTITPFLKDVIKRGHLFWKQRGQLWFSVACAGICVLHGEPSANGVSSAAPSST